MSGHDDPEQEVAQVRAEIQAVIRRVRGIRTSVHSDRVNLSHEGRGRHLAIAVTKLEEASLWLGADLP